MTAIFNQCPACGSNDTKIVAEATNSVHMLKCRNCALVFAVPLWNSKNAQDALSTYSGWPKGISGEVNNRFRGLLAVARQLQKYISPNAKILDVGCGEGTFFEILHSTTRTWELYGCEPGSRWRDQKYAHAQVSNSTLAETNFQKNFFDAITLLDVLYYVPDIESELKLISTLLKPNGLLVFDLQQHLYLKIRSILGSILGIKYTSAFTAYPWYFSEKAIQVLLDRAGLKILNTTIIRGVSYRNPIAEMSSYGYLVILRSLERLLPSVRRAAPRILYFVGLQDKLHLESKTNER